jgi:hypothetical protein
MDNVQNCYYYKIILLCPGDTNKKFYHNCGQNAEVNASLCFTISSTKPRRRVRERLYRFTYSSARKSLGVSGHLQSQATFLTGKEPSG